MKRYPLFASYRQKMPSWFDDAVDALGSAAYRCSPASLLLGLAALAGHYFLWLCIRYQCWAELFCTLFLVLLFENRRRWTA